MKHPTMAEELKRIRATLRRRMTDDGGHGFIFYSVHGCEEGRTFYEPHVKVRVELRWDRCEGGFLKFKVYVDYQPPSGADLESAQRFKKAVIDATRKAAWAEGLTRGLHFDREEI